MKESLIFLPLTIFYLSLKSTLFPNFPAPDLPLVIIFYMAFRRASLEGVLLGFTLGYIDDAFSGGIIGSTSFTLLFIYIAIHLLSKKVHFSTPAMKAGTVGVSGLFKGIITYFILRFMNLDTHIAGWTVLHATITAISTPAIISLLSWLASLAGPRAFKDNAD